MINYSTFIKELLGIFRKYYSLIIGLIIFLMIVFFMQIMLIDMTAGTEAEIPVNVILYFISALIQLGLYRIAYNLTHGIKADFSMMLFTGGYLFNFIIASLMYYLASIAGFFLLIIPGIIIAVGFMFYPFLIIDRNMMPLRALRESWKMARNNLWQLFVMWFVLYFINVMGVLLFYIGVMITLPFTTIAQALMYKQLKGEFNGKEEDIAGHG